MSTLIDWSGDPITVGDLRSNFEADSLDCFTKLARIGLFVTILRFDTEGEFDLCDNLVGVELL